MPKLPKWPPWVKPLTAVSTPAASRLEGSERRPAPKAEFLGPADPKETLSVTNRWPPPLARASRSRATGGAAVALKARAARAALAIIKSRAQTFARIPALLDNIEPELSILTPRQMAARAAQLFRNELAMPRGFGGEVPAMNLKAAAWYGRYLRAKESQLRRRRAQ
jgi:hypothetical protein